MMLKGNQFPFVIDLACWASKREFLKLDIWMVEKIKEHQVSGEGKGGSCCKSHLASTATYLHCTCAVQTLNKALLLRGVLFYPLVDLFGGVI